MKKILPFDISIIENYQCDAFIMGIIQSYDRIKQLAYNYFVNLQCNREIELNKLDIRYVRSLWGEMWEEGIAELNLFHFKNFNEKTLFEFLKERIDSNSYLLFYEVDEYFLSYSEKYKKKHYKHDLYIYGYEDDFFHVLAYSKNKLEKIKVNKKEIINCVLKTNMNDIGNFCSFRIAQAVEVKIDSKYIARNIDDYCHERTGFDNTNQALGMEVWKYIINSIEKYMKGGNYIQEEFDLRVFRMVWEHKKLMSNRLNALTMYSEIDSSIESEMKEQAEQAYIAFQLALKYTVDPKHKCDYLKKIIKIYKELEEKEKLLYPKIVSSIQMIGLN